MPATSASALVHAITFLFLAAAGTARADVFINEIHYDNSGTDTGEFVEVAGDAGTDLGGWSIILYNGNGGGVYNTIDLSGSVDDEGTGFGAVEFQLPTNGLQNGSPDGIALIDPDGMVIEFLSYEGAFTASDGTASGQTSVDIGVQESSGTPVGSSLQRTGAPNSLTDTAPWAGPAPASPGELNAEAEPEPEPELVRIHTVQGNGPSVTTSAPIRVQGIVTALFEDNDQVEGFFLQEEDSDTDADPSTSEGIFVFCNQDCPALLTAGQLVTVTGVPSDFFGMSQIGAATPGAVVIDAPTGGPVSPVRVRLPAPAPTDQEATFERYEGMLVEFPDTLAVSEYFQLARFGTIVLTLNERMRQFTDSNQPDAAGYAEFLEQLGARRIILDDMDNDQNDPIVNGPNPDESYFHPAGGFSTSNFFRGGDTIGGLIGVLHWSFAGASGTDGWRVRPVPGERYEFVRANPRTTLPDHVDGRLKVATFNVLNYFTTIDVTSSNSTGDCGPGGTLDCRGADSAAELRRQTDKIVAALVAMDADIVGLIEIENDSGAAVQNLVTALNEASGETYDFIDTGSLGGDAIKVAYIYRTDAVALSGDFAVLDGSVDSRFIDTKNRPMLAQTFREVSTDARFTAVLGHLKSKGSSCDDVGDPDMNDGQGNCNGTRTMAMEALLDWLLTDPTGSEDPDFMILGDLNAYASEDPIATLESAAYVNLVQTYSGGSAYSYVFDGQLGYLDHALASPTLAGQIGGITEWHINADEVNVLDYNDAIDDPGEASFERKSDALPVYQPDPYRSSDHDPLLVGLNLAVLGDINGDACVDRSDRRILLADLLRFRLREDYDGRSDLNSDGAITGRDLALITRSFTNRFGAPCR